MLLFKLGDMVNFMKNLPIENLQQRAKHFVQERDWEQYQTPRDVCMSLSIEASELLELFLWLKDTEVAAIKDNQKKMPAIKDEIADVFYWVIRLADMLNIDLEVAFLEKLKKNELKYPVETCKGKTEKYTELQTLPE